MSDFQISDFEIGMSFATETGRYRVTDKGQRTLVVIRIDLVKTNLDPLDEAAAEAAGWFNGPPYAVSEIVFDEDDILSITCILSA